MQKEDLINRILSEDDNQFDEDMAYEEYCIYKQQSKFLHMLLDLFIADIDINPVDKVMAHLYLELLNSGAIDDGDEMQTH